LGSNKSIPPPRSLFQQKVIARLSLRLSYFDDQERKKRNIEKKTKGKMQDQKKESKEEKTTNQI
jgi:hypothetical protein